MTIIRDDGVRHELAPVGDRLGNFLDGQGRTVCRESELGRSVQIYRFPDEGVYVYWQTIAASRDSPARRYYQPKALMQ